MNDLTREYINKVAESVRTCYGVSYPVTDMIAIVSSIGGRIEEQIGLDDCYDGTIRKVGTDGFTIIISPFQSEQRKNFAIAHELGHLFLHMGYRTNVEAWKNQDEVKYRRFGSTEQEYQANEFAAALLMPAEDFGKAIYELAVENKVNMTLVAERFNVSLSAAINRGRSLGILGR